MLITEEQLSGWGNYPKSFCQLVSPADADAAKETLSASKLIARGLGRSYGDQATNDGNLVVCSRRMDNFISWDEGSGILECQSGVSLEEIISTFAPRGWFPLITPGTKHVTIGGCIANDIHGKGHHIDGSFYTSVEEIKALLANGETITANREHNAEYFSASFGGLGLLGIILSAKIRLRKLETTYFSQRTISVRDLEELLDSFEEYDHQYHYQIAWVDSLARGKQLGRGVTGFANHATVAELPDKLKVAPLKVHRPAKIDIPFYLPNFTLNQWSVRILNGVLDIMQSRAANIVHYEKLLYPLDGVKNWNRGYGTRGFIQYQFVIPLADGRRNIRRLLNEIASSGMLPFLNVLKKFGKGIGGLSFPMEGYTFAIDFPYHPKLSAFCNRLDDLVLDCGGRIYLGKDAMLKEDMFKEMYPQYRDWLEIKAQFDPMNRFQSDISRRLGLIN